MFLSDTNVDSETLRPPPEPVVEAWIVNRLATDLFFSAVGEAELRYGVAILAAGRRQAAITRSRDTAVVTRNVRDYQDIEAKVVDPWTAV